MLATTRSTEIRKLCDRNTILYLLSSRAIKGVTLGWFRCPGFSGGVH